MTEFSTAEYVREYFSDIEIMSDIAWCESKFVHTNDDGSILRGDPNPSDVGVMQINEYYHSDRAEALGLDLHTLIGNVSFARDLYIREGTAPWISSMGCWGEENYIYRE